MTALHFNPQAVLPRSFFMGSAAAVARALVGHYLLHDTPDGCTAGRIVETEAYDQTDAASHSHRGLTPRNAVMFGPAGFAYVYRSYGIHWCMNVSVGEAGHGAAVLFRALEPVCGLPLMTQRRGGSRVPSLRLAQGPGCLTQALGVTGAHDGMDMLHGPLRLVHGPGCDRVLATPRVGISKAVDVPWRFVLAGSRYVSRGPSMVRAR